MYHQPECGIQIDLFRIFLSASSSTGPTDAVQGEETTVIFYFTLWKASNKKRKVSNADEEGRVWSIRTTEREREAAPECYLYSGFFGYWCCYSAGWKCGGSLFCVWQVRALDVSYGHSTHSKRLFDSANCCYDSTRVSPVKRKPSFKIRKKKKNFFFF